MDSSVKDNGEVWVDGHLIGRLDGLKFVPDETGSDVEAKALLATAAQSVGPEIDRRLTSLSGGTHAIFTLSDKGEILWGGKPVGRIASSGTVFNPDAELIGGQLGNTNLQTMATQRMRDYLKAEVTAKLAPLEALKTLSNSDTALPEAKGFAYTLLEGFGSIDRSSQGKLVKALDQDARKQLREVGVFFGQYHVFMRDMLKPKPATLLSLLVAYGAGGDKKPFIPFAGVTSIPNEGELASKNFSKEALALMGFKAAGPRIVRFDILDRLAGLIRQAQSENGSRRFQVMQEMLALLGSNYEDVRGVLTAIGYKSEVVEPKPETETKAEPNSETAETAIPVEQIKSDTAVQGIPPKDDAQPSATDMSTPSGAISDAVVASTSVVGAPPEDLAKAAPETAPAPKPARKQPQPLQVYNPREEDADGNTVELENNEFWFYPMRPKGPAKNSRGNPKRGNKAQHRKGSGGNDSRKKSAPKPAIKPEDSPFAALLALKGKKD